MTRGKGFVFALALGMGLLTAIFMTPDVAEVGSSNYSLDPLAEVPFPSLTGSAPLYVQAIRSASLAYGIPRQLIAAVIACESNWDARASSKKGARGLMQVMPSTARGGFDNRLSGKVAPSSTLTNYRIISVRCRTNMRLALASRN